MTPNTTYNDDKEVCGGCLKDAEIISEKRNMLTGRLKFRVRCVCCGKIMGAKIAHDGWSILPRLHWIRRK